MDAGDFCSRKRVRGWEVDGDRGHLFVDRDGSGDITGVLRDFDGERIVTIYFLSGGPFLDC